jgi:hypothetical protein
MTQFYFFDLIDKYNIIFHSLFKEIYIKRLNKSTDVYDLTLRVPIHGENRTKNFIYNLNRNLETVGAKLPIIGISDPIENINDEIRRFALKGLDVIDKEDREIIKRIPSPIPVDFSFEVSVWAEYAHDMNQITEQIIGNFSEIIVKPVNIIQDLAVYIEVPIVMNSDIDNKSRFDSLVIENFTNLRRKSFFFTLTGFIFKPIQLNKLLKRTILRSDEFKVISTLANSPNDLIDSNDGSFAEINQTLLNIYTYNFTEERYNLTFIEDMSEYISLHGESLELINQSTGNAIPYVFEYSNGEWYSNDDVIPSIHTGVIKSGRVAFFVEKVEIGNLKIRLDGIGFNSYYDANDVFNSYNDFNKRHFHDMMISNKTSANYTYINSGVLVTLFHTKDTIEEAVKVIPKNAITERLKEFACSFTNYTADDDNILFGLLDEEGNYLYITGDYILKESRLGVVSNINTFTGISISTILNIKFTFSATAITVTINDKTYEYVTSNNYVNCFIGGSQTPLYAEYFYSRRIN